MNVPRFLSAADAARVLDVTPAAVRLMAKTRILPVAAMTKGGIRLFNPADVAALASERRGLKRSQKHRSKGR